MGPGYARPIRQWVLTLASFFVRRVWLVPAFTRAAIDAYACAKGRPRAATAAVGTAEEPTAAHREGRLLARPRPATGPAPTGLHRLGDTTGAPLLYVPAGYRPNRPAGVLLLLHGATSVGLAILAQLVPFADAANLILLAPNARLRTWDRIHGIAGPDVGTIDHALEHVFTRYAVDSRRLAVAGFSDGASFALSLGLTNGDLFADVIALSPGFLPAGTFHGHPRVFISHGTQDEVLPIRCSQRIVELLRASGYDVTYAEFAGPHVVPPDLARAAVTWISSAAGLTARH